jgi:hypothetical protein
MGKWVIVEIVNRLFLMVLKMHPKKNSSFKHPKKITHLSILKNKASVLK